MAVGLNQIRKVPGATNTAKEDRRCFSCQGYGHLARECPSPQAADAKLSRPARSRAERCDRCSMDGHTAAECQADWETAARRAGHRPPADRARPAITHLGEEAMPPPSAAATLAAAASDAAPKFGTVPARINMMSGPYEAAQVTGFGLHHMGVEPPPVSQIQEPDNLRHFCLNAMMPTALPAARGPRQRCC